MSTRGRTPLRAIVEHATEEVPPPAAPAPLAWKPVMTLTAVGRLCDVSYNTLVKWLDNERRACGCTLRDLVCVGVSGQVWVKTPAFRAWLEGTLLCRCDVRAGVGASVPHLRVVGGNEP